LLRRQQIILARMPGYEPPVPPPVSVPIALPDQPTDEAVPAAVEPASPTVIEQEHNTQPAEPATLPADPPA
jgi:hypothetical protein